MKKLLLPLLTLLLPVLAGAQENYKFACYYGEAANPNALCMRMRSFSATPSRDAADAIRNILRPIGLAPNFVLVPCDNIENAAAVTLDDGFRYIVYDRKFMDAIANRAQTNWSYTAILAHEVGHHLQGHTTTSSSSLAQRRRQELEADEFSGFVLQKMGATLAQAQAAMQALPEPEDETRSDHPARWRRLAAIKNGYDRASGVEATPAATPEVNTPEPETTPEPARSETPVRSTHTELTRHDILSASEFPSLRSSWDKGFQLSEAVWADNRWYVFLKKTDETKNQSYRIRNSFPTDDIREMWNKQKNVTSINYYNNQWVLVMSEQAGNPNQRLRRRSYWPTTEIRESWDAGFYISDVTYGEGEYVVLFNDKASIGYIDQQYHSSKEFPEQKIRELWDQGYRINVLKFLNGEWVLVMTKYRGSDSVVQRWNTRDSFPLDVLLKNEGEGYLLRNAAFDGKTWAIVMDK